VTQEGPEGSLARFQRDIDYYESHYDELLQQFPEQWVAIYKQRVVGSDDDLDRLLQQLKQEGIPIEKALIEDVTAEEEFLILPRELYT
jgi:hypothetical protein